MADNTFTIPPVRTAKSMASRRDVLKIAGLAVAVEATRSRAANRIRKTVPPTGLTCEYLVDPLGVDTMHPRLSWMLGSAQRGERQTGYQILVAREAALLQPGKADIWDSGHCASNQSVLVPYTGSALMAGGRYFWTVRTWDVSTVASPWAAPASWEMGMLKPKDWQPAQWIQLAQDARTSPLITRPLQTGPMKKPTMVKTFPSPLFRKTFSIGKAVSRARMYICGLGYYELCM
ncbi:MAG: hypothetical protein M0Z50_02020, partial [Planctomycetia bacterium]|nr:hypothetical protein [Planctomycetia bacterium]